MHIAAFDFSQGHWHFLLNQPSHALHYFTTDDEIILLLLLFMKRTKLSCFYNEPIPPISELSLSLGSFSE